MRETMKARPALSSVMSQRKLKQTNAACLVKLFLWKYTEAEVGPSV